METVDEVLAHYGVKGQKWGVRNVAKLGSRIPKSMTPRATTPLSSKAGAGLAKAIAKSKAPQAVKVQDRGKSLTVSGGKRQPTSEDARASAEAARKVKKSGIKSLSTKELQALTQRQQLEETYSKQAGKRKSAGRKFTEGVLTKFGDEIIKDVAKNWQSYGSNVIDALQMDIAIDKITHL